MSGNPFFDHPILNSPLELSMGGRLLVEAEFNKMIDTVVAADVGAETAT